MALPAGKLRHYVELQTPVEFVNTEGERESTWAHVAYIWASIEPMSGKEFTAAQQMQSKITTRITIRRRADIDPTMRILYRNQFFNIEGVLSDPVSGLEYQTLPCSSGVIDPSIIVTLISGGTP